MISFRVMMLLMIAADLVWWRGSDARLARLPRPRLWRGLLGCFVGSMVLYLLCFLIVPQWVRQSHNPMPLSLHAAVYLWHMLVLPLSCVALLLSAGGRAARAGARRLSRGREESATAAVAAPSRPAEEGRLNRRQLLGAAAAAVPPLVTAGLVGRSVYQLDQFRINRVTVPVSGLPADLDGLTITQVSDVHIGKLTRPNLLPRLIEATNGLGADLVVLTGDLIDLSINDLPSGIDFVRRLRPRHGPGFLAMIEGNHDLIDDPRRFHSEVRSAGIPLLLDEATTMRLPGRATPVQLLGLRWSAEGARRGGEPNIAPSMARLLPQRDPDAFPILLAHHPHAFDPAAAAGIRLTLAGHTHGGQVMLTPHFGPGSWVYRYYSGLYRKGRAHAFVSNGVGNWFPLRLNAPAEIVHLTLRRA